MNYTDQFPIFAQKYSIALNRSYYKLQMALIYNVQSFAEWKQRKESEKNAKSSKKSRVIAYKPKAEEPPNHPWYTFDKSGVDRQIMDISSLIKHHISTARAEDTEMNGLRDLSEHVQQVTQASYTEVALVGMQGVGKSLLINALMDRNTLSETSADGGACTASAIKYLHQPDFGDRKDKYDIEIEFMNDEYLDEIIGEHVKNYNYFHFMLNDNDEFSEDEEQAAATAYDFFFLVFDTNKENEKGSRLEQLLTAEAIQSGLLLRETIEMARERIKSAAEDESGKRSVRNVGIKKLSEFVNGYIAQSETGQSMWPLVQSVNI
jgi:hypothetical protein